MKLSKERISSLLNIILGLLLVIYLFQITVADDYSFNNEPINHFLHFAENYVLITFILTLLIKIFLIAKKLWIKIVIGILSVPIIGLFLLSSVFMIGVVFASEHSNMRHYFYEKEGYKYYLVSERYWAFEGSSNLKYYKEKPIFLFINHRPAVNKKELEELGINIGKVSGVFFNKYFKK